MKIASILEFNKIYPWGICIPKEYEEVGFQLLKTGDRFISSIDGSILTSTKKDNYVRRLVIKPLTKQKKRRKL